MDVGETEWWRRCWESIMRADLLSLAAGTEQLPCILAAQEMGFSVLAMDGNAEAPGLKMADIGLNVNARDEASAEKIAREAAVKALLPIPLGALLRVAGKINTALGLPGPQERATEICTDKLLQRRTLEAAGLAQPRYFFAQSREEIRDRAERLASPCVVKPRFGSGSHAVFVAENSRQLADLLPWHLGNAGETQSLVESCQDGIEYGVDGAVTAGKFHLLAVREKELTPLPYRVNRGFFTPANCSAKTAEAIAQSCARAAEAVGLGDCLVHFDVIVSPEGEAVIIELSGRPSGYNISAKMLPAALGFSPIAEMTRHLLGQKADFRPKSSRGAVLRMLQADPGVVEQISGLAEASEEVGVVALETFLREGSEVKACRDGASGYKVGYLITSGETRAEAEVNWQRAAAHLKIKTRA